LDIASAREKSRRKVNDEKQNEEATRKGGGCMIKGFVQGQTLKLAQTRVVADSSIKTYIDDYINEALGGDY
jgi:hypothetical protein